jgi:hypothetical protein
MKSKRFLFGIVVVLLMVALVLPGCNNEEQLVEAKELMIPSSISPYEVFNETANAGPRVLPLPLFFQEVWTAENMDPYAMPQGANEEQFIEGYYAGVPELLYIKRDGERVGCGFTRLVMDIFVLKYENPESAERSFINISETQELQNLTYEGIALKNGTCFIPDWEGVEEYYWDERNQPCYLIHSGCFIIYYYGRGDVLNDMLDRIIAAFGVKSSSNQSQAGNTT